MVPLPLAALATSRVLNQQQTFATVVVCLFVCLFVCLLLLFCSLLQMVEV
jgi:hypothetical protein